MTKTRVCVIGGGAAGLSAGRNMIHSPEMFDFTIFEQSDEVGGTWNYTNYIGVDDFQLPIHSSMYKNLRTNVPKEIMGFPDFPFPNEGDSFSHHTDVLEYLRNYAKKHKLNEKIKFRSQVLSVTPETTNEGSILWKIDVKDLLSGTNRVYDFDAVMICNGHYAVPNIPSIPGIETYEGESTHSHSYRDPDPFKNKTVVVLGAASSGMDISIEVASVAKQIYLSHNLLEKHKSALPSNVTQVPGIKSAHAKGFILQDDTNIDAEAILYCTGYLFNFPFLSEKCKVRIEGNRVLPLYKHLIHIEFPTLCFVGLPFNVLPFPMFHFQVQYFLKTLDGTMALPSKTEMSNDAEKDYKKRVVDMRMPHKHAHKMGPLQWDYFNELGNEAQFQTLPPVYKIVYENVERQRKDNVMWYKNGQYRLVSGEEYIRTMPEP